MYKLSERKAQSIEGDVPSGQEPIYGVVAYDKDGSDRSALMRVILILDRTGGMLCHNQAELHLN